MILPVRPKIARFRSARHLARLRTLPCCVPGCRKGPVDAHHLTHVQKRGLGQKASDSLAVPLCRFGHHSAASNNGVHHVGNERAWWAALGIDPEPIAAVLWAETERP